MINNNIKKRGNRTLRVDLTGKQFKYFKVIGLSKEQDPKHLAKWWDCLCVCGKVFHTSTSRIMGNSIRSCGCKNFCDPHGNISMSAKDATYRLLINSYKNTCRRRHRLWELSDEQALEFFNNDCYYCGIKPSSPRNAFISREGNYLRSRLKTPRSNYLDRVKQGTVLVNGIDRIDSKIGYTLNNCVACCTYCNFAKNDRSQAEFLDWVKLVATYQGFIK